MGTSSNTAALKVGGTITLRNVSVTTTSLTGTSSTNMSDVTFYVFGNNYGYSTSITGDPTLLTVPQIIAYSQVPVFQIKVNASFFIHRQSDGSYVYLDGSAALDSVTVLTGSVVNPDGSTSRYNSHNGSKASIVLSSPTITGGVDITTFFDSSVPPARSPSFRFTGQFDFERITGTGPQGNYAIFRSFVDIWPALQQIGSSEYQGILNLSGGANLDDSSQSVVDPSYWTVDPQPKAVFGNMGIDRYNLISPGIVKMIMKTPTLSKVTGFKYQMTNNAGSGGPMDLKGINSVRVIYGWRQPYNGA